MTSGNFLQTDRRLFRAEIRASIAHCNALFRAGILTRIEAERLKNGLWTILKRADFDRQFFDHAPASDVYSFVNARLFQLVNEAADALKVGRSRPHQIAAALRLWLRDEIEIISESLENLHEVLQNLSDDEKLAAAIENFLRDEARFNEIRARVNQMPAPVFAEPDEQITELDFEGIAHELGFAGVSQNSLDAAQDRDFCVEFVGAAALTMLHLANLTNALPEQQIFEIVRGKSAKIFGYSAALLSLLNNSRQTEADFAEISEIVFDANDTLKNCLSAVTTNLKKLV